MTSVQHERYWNWRTNRTLTPSSLKLDRLVWNTKSLSKVSKNTASEWMESKFKLVNGDVNIARVIMDLFQFSYTSHAAPVSLYRFLYERNLLVIPNEVNGESKFLQYLDLVNEINPDLSLEELWLSPLELDLSGYPTEDNPMMYTSVTEPVLEEVKLENARLAWRRATSHEHRVLTKADIPHIESFNRSYLNSNPSFKPRSTKLVSWLPADFLRELIVIDKCFRDICTWRSFYQFLSVMSTSEVDLDYVIDQQKTLQLTQSFEKSFNV